MLWREQERDEDEFSVRLGAKKFQTVGVNSLVEPLLLSVAWEPAHCHIHPPKAILCATIQDSDSQTQSQTTPMHAVTFPKQGHGVTKTDFRGICSDNHIFVDLLLLTRDTGGSVVNSLHR
jgi:hypothetical protein